MIAKAELVRKNLKAFTWYELETNGKFDKNAKLTFISDDMLILGGDAGSETYYLRAIDVDCQVELGSFHSQLILERKPGFLPRL